MLMMTQIRALTLLILIVVFRFSHQLEIEYLNKHHFLFVAILTNSHDYELRAAVRDTWLQFLVTDARASHRFFTWREDVNVSTINQEASEKNDIEFIKFPRSVGDASTTWGNTTSENMSNTFVLIHNGDAVQTQSSRIGTNQHCNQAYIEVKKAQNWPECRNYPCRKGCQVGHLSLAATRYYLLHTSAQYLLRLDADGFLCVPSLLQEISSTLIERGNSHYFRAYYYPHYTNNIISCRADENFMMFSRSVASAVWRTYFGYRPVLSYRHENSFADNAEVAIHMMYLLINASEHNHFIIIDDREKTDSMQGWHLQGRHGHSGQGDPNAQTAAASACAPLEWIHKIKSGIRLREIWAAMEGNKSWITKGKLSWKPLNAPSEFWTKRNGDARCSNVLEAIRGNSPLIEAARPLIQSLASDRNTVPNFQRQHAKGVANQKLSMIGPVLHATSPVHMMHIPKTAGYSIRSELEKRFSLKVGHTEEYLIEFLKRWPRGHVFTMIRNPRAHILSQYLECKYDDWGKWVTNGTLFPRNVGDEAGFNEWLENFLMKSHSYKRDPVDRSYNDFKCYNPWNMQSRYLTRGRPSFMNGQPKYAFNRHLPGHHAYSDEDCVPASSQAIRSLESLTWIGVVELFHESLCLLEFQFKGKTPEACTCSSSQQGEVESHETHHVPVHDVKNLTEDTVKKVDRLSSIDSIVYSNALALVLNRIRTLESAHSCQIICPDRLKGLRTELKYLPVAVAAIDCYAQGKMSSLHSNTTISTGPIALCV